MIENYQLEENYRILNSSNEVQRLIPGKLARNENRVVDFYFILSDPLIYLCNGRCVFIFVMYMLNENDVLTFDLRVLLLIRM